MKRGMATGNRRKRQKGQTMILLAMAVSVLVTMVTLTFLQFSSTQSARGFQSVADVTLHRNNYMAVEYAKELLNTQAILPLATSSGSSGGQGLIFVGNPASSVEVIGAQPVTLYSFSGSGNKCTSSGCPSGTSLTTNFCDSFSTPFPNFQGLYYHGTIPSINTAASPDNTQPCPNSVSPVVTFTSVNVAGAAPQLTLALNISGQAYRRTGGAGSDILRSLAGIQDDGILGINAVPYAPVPTCALTPTDGVTPNDIVPGGTSVTYSMNASIPAGNCDSADLGSSVCTTLTSTLSTWATGGSLVGVDSTNGTTSYSNNASPASSAMGFPATSISDPMLFAGEVVGPSAFPAPSGYPTCTTSSATSFASDPSCGACGSGRSLSGTTQCPANYSSCFSKIDIQPTCTISLYDATNSTAIVSPYQLTTGTAYTVRVNVSPAYTNPYSQDDITLVTWWDNTTLSNPTTNPAYYGGGAGKFVPTPSNMPTTLTATLKVTNPLSGNTYTSPACNVSVSYPKPVIVSFIAVDNGPANPALSTGANSGGASISEAYYDDKVQLQWTTQNVTSCTLDAVIYNAQTTTSYNGSTLCGSNVGNGNRPTTQNATSNVYPYTIPGNNLGNNGSAGTFDLATGSDNVGAGPSCTNPYTETYNDVYYYLSCSGNGQTVSTATPPSPGLSVSRWCYGAGGASNPSYFNATEAEAWACCKYIATSAVSGPNLNCIASSATYASWGPLKCVGGMPYSLSGNINYYGPYRTYPWCMCYDPLKVYGDSPFNYGHHAPNWSLGSPINPCGRWSSLGLSGPKPAEPPND